jgi:hypothetical protein
VASVPAYTDSLPKDRVGAAVVAMRDGRCCCFRGLGPAVVGASAVGGYAIVAGLVVATGTTTVPLVAAVTTSATTIADLAVGPAAVLAGRVRAEQRWKLS